MLHPHGGFRQHLVGKSGQVHGGADRSCSRGNAWQNRIIIIIIVVVVIIIVVVVVVVINCRGWDGRSEEIVVAIASIVAPNSVAAAAEHGYGSRNRAGKLCNNIIIIIIIAIAVKRCFWA